MNHRLQQLEESERTYLDVIGKKWLSPGVAEVSADQRELDKMLAGGYYVVEVDKMGVLRVVNRVTRVGLSYEEFTGEDEVS